MATGLLARLLQGGQPGLAGMLAPAPGLMSDPLAARGNPQAQAFMAQNRPQTVTGAHSFAPAPQGQPMPQGAPAASPAAPAAGNAGGLGGLLSNLFNPGASQRNATVEWLMRDGLDEGTATFMASDRDAMRQYIANRNKGKDPLDIEYKRAQIDNIRSQIDERTNPNAREQFGLNPIYGKDEDGNLIVLQPSKAGGLVQADIPDGVTLQPGVDKIDLGTNWGITDRSGSIISVIPKDLAGAEAQKAAGKAQGEAAFDIPRAELTANQTIQRIDELLASPDLDKSVGFVQGRLPPLSEGVQDFRNRLEQLQGSAFLEAYAMLKGGGQITEVEGLKAERAMARLQTTSSDKEFRQALKDFKQAIGDGLAKLRKQAGVATPSPATTAAPSPDRTIKSIKDLSDEELEAIINGG